VCYAIHRPAWWWRWNDWLQCNCCILLATPWKNSVPFPASLPLNVQDKGEQEWSGQSFYQLEAEGLGTVLEVGGSKGTNIVRLCTFMHYARFCVVLAVWVSESWCSRSEGGPCETVQETSHVQYLTHTICTLLEAEDQIVSTCAFTRTLLSCTFNS